MGCYNIEYQMNKLGCINTQWNNNMSLNVNVLRLPKKKAGATVNINNKQIRRSIYEKINKQIV